MSPAISSVTKSVEISGCGIQNTLSVRKLDTGSIRVKNNNTLILTGVLQHSDNSTTSKFPILGDIPILGSLFRSNSTQKRKSELIILVTPKILKDKWFNFCFKWLKEILDKLIYLEREGSLIIF